MKERFVGRDLECSGGVEDGYAVTFGVGDGSETGHAAAGVELCAAPTGSMNTVYP